jgi:hypothetical protein
MLIRYTVKLIDRAENDIEDVPEDVARNLIGRGVAVLLSEEIHTDRAMPPTPRGR